MRDDDTPNSPPERHSDSESHEDHLPPNPRDARRRNGAPTGSLLRPVTLVLIGASVVLAVLTSFGANRELLSHFVLSQFPLLPQNPAASLLPEIRAGQWWRLLTPMLVHLSLPHIIFNMLALGNLGSPIERQMGSWRYLALVLALNFISEFAQYFVAGGYAGGGMSGVIFGLFGYIWMQGKFNPAGGLVLSQQDITMTLIFFLLCFTGLVGPIANGAHAGGLIAGALIGVAAAFRANADILRRRHEFQRSMVPADEPMHCCKVCGATERTAPDIDFRVASDGEEYCEAHLPSRQARLQPKHQQQQQPAV